MGRRGQGIGAGPQGVCCSGGRSVGEWVIIMKGDRPVTVANSQKQERHMSQTLPYQQMGTAARGQAHALFAQTMGYVALTAGLFALGAWLGRNFTGGVGIVLFIAAFAVLIAMRFAVRRSVGLTVALLAAFGLLIGLAMAPTLAYYGTMDPSALWQAGAATALFIAGFGAAGYATRRDLTVVARVCFWALVALIAFGIVLIFVHIPHGALVYSVLGLVIFAGFTMFDFQRLRTNTDNAQAPLLAASIFLDVLNVFLFFLEIFSGDKRIWAHTSPVRYRGGKAMMSLSSGSCRSRARGGSAGTMAGFPVSRPTSRASFLSGSGRFSPVSALFQPGMRDFPEQRMVRSGAALSPDIFGGLKCFAFTPGRC